MDGNSGKKALRNLGTGFGDLDSGLTIIVLNTCPLKGSLKNITFLKCRLRQEPDVKASSDCMDLLIWQNPYTIALNERWTYSSLKVMGWW